MRWGSARRARKAAERAAAAEEVRRRQQRAWHEFWDAMNVARGGTSIPYDEANYP